MSDVYAENHQDDSAERADDADDILASLEKEAQHLCYDEPSSPIEQRLANAIACLIAVIRNERRARIKRGKDHG